MKRGFLLATAFLVLSFALAAQDSQIPFTLRVTTQLVVQTVSVTDKDGKPIHGLTKDDFVLTEDSIPQTISVLEFQNLEDIVLPGARPPAPASAEKTGMPQPRQAQISAPLSGRGGYQDRRLLALYFDMPTMSEADRFRALDAAQTFIDKYMTGSDLVAVITFSDGAVRVRTDFTDDRASLHRVFNTDRQLAAIQTTVNMLGVTAGKKVARCFHQRYESQW
jgi:VWFA-related protein